MGVLASLSDSLSYKTIFLAPALIFPIYLASLVIYRLYFSPARGFPGPKLAAITYLYEGYYNIVLPGQFTTNQLIKLHKQYGPIVRINPEEIHINDPEYFDTIYSFNPNLHKTRRFKWRFNLCTSVFSTESTAHHRIRRAALNPFFSKGQIGRYWPFIAGFVDKFCSRVIEFKEEEKLFPLNDAASCFATDVVTEYCFANCYDTLSLPNFESPLIGAMRNLMYSMHIMAHFPWLLTMLNALPEWLVGLLDPSMLVVFKFQRNVGDQVQRTLRGENDEKAASHTTVFKGMMDSGLPPHELTAQRLHHEGQGLVGAGVETTRAGLTTATFWIIETPRIFKRLREELEKAIPDPNVIPPLAELEALPYLSGCIMECLRLSYGVAQRSPRVSYNQVFTYTVPASAPPSHHPGKSYTIPTGCVMGMSTPLIHHNEAIFPDSYAFYPERWLDASDPSGKRKDLQSHFMSFGKGSRQCLGMNLAFAELYALMGMLFRRFEFELVNTTKENVMPAEEYFVPFPKGGKADTWVKVL